MACATQIQNVKIDPVDVYFEQPEMFCMEQVADVAGSLGGTYWTFDTPSNAYYVWYDTGSDVDPAVANRIGVEISITASDSAAVISGLVVTALDALADVNAKLADGSVDDVVVEAVASGAVTAAADVDAGVTITQLRAGADLDLGLIEGNVTFGLAQETFEVTAHQQGPQVLGRIITAKNIESVSIQLKETDVAKLKAFIEAAGASTTPAGGTEVFGYGTGTNGLNQDTKARKLVFNPRSSGGRSVKGSDYCFWRAFPNVSELLFSGEEDNKITVEFQIQRDEKKVANLDTFIVGDHTQNLLK